MTAASATTSVTVGALKEMLGREVGVSSWVEVNQAQVNAFADVTNDHQFIHVDPARAANTPFGGTIAHGFLTLSLLSAMGLEAQPKIIGAVMGINYGFDKVRFLLPVKTGSRVRGRFVLSDVQQNKPGELDVNWEATVEIEGGKRPALVAAWLNRFYLEPDIDDDP